jgi:hypothetical protein
MLHHPYFPGHSGFLAARLRLDASLAEFRV